MAKQQPKTPQPKTPQPKTPPKKTVNSDLSSGLIVAMLSISIGMSLTACIQSTTVKQALSYILGSGGVHDFIIFLDGVQQSATKIDELSNKMDAKGDAFQAQEKDIADLKAKAKRLEDRLKALEEKRTPSPSSK